MYVCIKKVLNSSKNNKGYKINFQRSFPPRDKEKLKRQVHRKDDPASDHISIKTVAQLQ